MWFFESARSGARKEETQRDFFFLLFFSQTMSSPLILGVFKYFSLKLGKADLP